MTLANRLEQRLVAAVGNPKPGDYNYLADVLEIVASDLGGTEGDWEPVAGVPTYLVSAAKQFRQQAREYREAQHVTWDRLTR